MISSMISEISQRLKMRKANLAAHGNMANSNNSKKEWNECNFGGVVKCVRVSKSQQWSQNMVIFRSLISEDKAIVSWMEEKEDLTINILKLTYCLYCQNWPQLVKAVDIATLNQL